MKKVKVLLVEDDPQDRKLVHVSLRGDETMQLEIQDTSTLESALTLLKETEIDVVLLDLNLTDSTGLDTLEQVSSVSRKVTVIVLTGLDDQEVALKAMGMGAQDYVDKGNIQGKMLIRVIRHSMERKRLEEEVITRVHELERLNRMMVDRELKIIQLKEENASLKRSIQNKDESIQ